MTIVQHDKVDGVGIDRASQEVVLVISDHLNWDDDADHFSNLERKISSYLDFVRTGQLYEQMPEAQGLAVRFRLICEHGYNEKIEEILNSIEEELTGMGIRFSWGLLPEGY